MAAGDQPDAAEVFEVDSGELMRQMRDMRDQGSFPSGRTIEPAPALFLGAAEMPAEPGDNWPAARLQAKIDNGTQFFQTQYCFDSTRSGATAPRWSTAVLPSRPIS